MGRVLLEDVCLLDPEAPEPVAGRLLLRDERIEARLAPGKPVPENARVVSCQGRFVAPAWIDLHHHGRLIFAEAGDFEAALEADSLALARAGTAAFLATTVAWPAVETARRVERLAACLARSDWPGAVPIGIHLEGPWLDPGSAGAQPTDGIRPFDPAEGDEVLARAGGALRMVTLAPEVEGANRLLDALVGRDVVAALGHTRATAEQAEHAAERGASHVTHLFNAMGPLHHRVPGVAGVALADARFTCDLICDGVHVDPRVVRTAARALGDRLVLITDRIEPTDDAFSFGSGALHDDGTALRLPDGRLAGSRLQLDGAFRNLQAFGGLGACEAAAACTLRPARVLGVERERGVLRPGARADLVLLESDGSVAETWLGGRPWRPD